jgi:lipopolysaccharide transport system permease protein
LKTGNRSATVPDAIPGTGSFVHGQEAPFLSSGAPLPAAREATAEVLPGSRRTPSPVLEIVPTRGWRGINFGDLWAYRELVHVLVWRDLKVRYRQTLLGVVWVMGQPILATAIFTAVFGRLVRIDAGGGLPYAVFVLTALLPWNFFAGGIQGAANSLVGNTSLITKVYFPRLLIPAATVVSGLVDLAVAALVLAGLLAWHRITISWTVLLLPAIVGLTLVLTLGIGLWLAALNVKYRDVRVIVPFVVQLWMFATPVVYPQSLVPEPWRELTVLNPMVGVVEGCRWCLFGGDVPARALAVTLGASLALLGGGALFFRRMERTFVDVI